MAHFLIKSIRNAESFLQWRYKIQFHNTVLLTPDIVRRTTRATAQWVLQFLYLLSTESPVVMHSVSMFFFVTSRLLQAVVKLFALNKKGSLNSFKFLLNSNLWNSLLGPAACTGLRVSLREFRGHVTGCQLTVSIILTQY